MIPRLELLQKTIISRFGMIVQNHYLGLNLGLKLYTGILLLQGGLSAEKSMPVILAPNLCRGSHNKPPPQPISRILQLGFFSKTLFTYDNVVLLSKLNLTT